MLLALHYFLICDNFNLFKLLSVEYLLSFFIKFILFKYYLGYYYSTNTTNLIIYNILSVSKSFIYLESNFNYDFGYFIL